MEAWRHGGMEAWRLGTANWELRTHFSSFFSVNISLSEVSLVK